MYKFSKVRKRKNKNQWAVYSSKGKKLSRWYPSRKKAVERLRQIEYFKNNSDDQSSDIIDYVNHENYKDTLSVKPIDVSNSKYAELKKEAFGHVMNTGYNSVQGEQTPKFDDVTYRFFGGEDDIGNEESLPSVNKKINDDRELDSLNLLKDKLIEEGEISEANRINEIIKISFDPSQLSQLGIDPTQLTSSEIAEIYRRIDLAGSVPDDWMGGIDTMTAKPVTTVPLLGNVGDPRSINVDMLSLKIPYVYNKGMAVAHNYYKKMTRVEAMEAIFEESRARIDSNEERAFAAIVYLLHQGYPCNARIVAYGFPHETISEMAKKIFNDPLSDFVIPGLLAIGIGTGVQSGFRGVSKIPAFIAGTGIGAYGFGGHIMQNLTISKIMPMLCEDPNSFFFKDGLFLYEKVEEEAADIKDVYGKGSTKSTVKPTVSYDDYYEVPQMSVKKAPVEEKKAPVGTTSDDQNTNDKYKDWGLSEEDIKFLESLNK